ncbi:LytR/AlgR family response regulator transcription factor [Pseudoalteromonas sp. T1lg65]|uniref:LytR/AlgR family response regulator transcription factor n=1 Tax=Pseudoalteromonas sp. T1lg65 TaxID=2077101 RepID=UPI003F7A1704
MNKLHVLIIDDEPLAHNIVLAYSDNVPFIEVVGQCYCATDALSFLQTQQVDLLFLDINMPMLSGLDLLKVLKTKPQVIITSAYQEYALESFELSVDDYLLKPFSFERFLQACNKVAAQYELRQKANQVEEVTAQTQDTIFITVDKKQVLINLGDVSCFEAYGNYVKVWREGKSVLTPRTLSSFEEQLPHSQFVRIHKSAIINLSHIDFIKGQKVMLLDGNEMSIGRAYKDQLHNRLY